MRKLIDLPDLPDLNDPENAALAKERAEEVVALHLLLEIALWEDREAACRVMGLDLTNDQRDFLRHFAALCQRERAGREKVC